LKRLTVSLPTLAFGTDSLSFVNTYYAKRVQGISAYHWLFYSFHEVCIDILNLDLVPGSRIRDPFSSSFNPLWLALNMIFYFTIGPVSFHVSLELSISILLVGIQALNEALDIGDWVPARIMPSWSFLRGWRCHFNDVLMTEDLSGADKKEKGMSEGAGNHAAAKSS
jgi:hypothetical protein